MKTAQKIIVELSGKLLSLGLDSGEELPDTTLSAPVAGNPDYDETLAALVMLGFSKAPAEKVVKALFKEEPTLTVEEAIRAALKRL